VTRTRETRTRGRGYGFRRVRVRVTLENPRVAHDIPYEARLNQTGHNEDSDGLARNAAASALQSHQYELSVTFLEGGRFIFWAQALQL